MFCLLYDSTFTWLAYKALCSEMCCIETGLDACNCWLVLTRHSTSTTSRWHFFCIWRYVVMCTDCQSAQWCTTRGHPYNSPKLHPGPYSSVGMRQGTDTHTDGCDHYTFRVVYDSREM